MKEFFNNTTAAAELALYLHAHCKIAVHPAAHLAYRMQRIAQGLHMSNVRLCQSGAVQKVEDKITARLRTKLSKMLVEEPTVSIVSFCRDPRGRPFVITGSNCPPTSVSAYAPGDEDHEA